jgi:hypothetical protein
MIGFEPSDQEKMSREVIKEEKATNNVCQHVQSMISRCERTQSTRTSAIGRVIYLMDNLAGDDSLRILK